MRFISNSEKKELNDLLKDEFKINKKDEIVEEGDLILRNSNKYLIITKKDKKSIKEVIPHLKSINNSNEACLKSIYIDSGAIPYLIKGADMMRPGIQKIDDEIKKEEIVLIRDLEHKKILGVGKSLYDSKEMITQQKGISIKVLHFVGDNKY